MYTSVFLLNIVYFSVCLISNKLYWIEDQLADVSARFIRRRVGVGELDRRRVDWIPSRGVDKENLSNHQEPHLLVTIAFILVTFMFDSGVIL